MPDTKKIKNTKIAFIMLSIMAVAGVLSFTTRTFAQDKPAPTSGMERVIKGTENWNGKYDISISKFLKNIGKSTGIYKMIHQPTAEELALEKAQAEAQLAAEENNPFDEAPKAPGKSARGKYWDCRARRHGPLRQFWRYFSARPRRYAIPSCA